MSEPSEMKNLAPSFLKGSLIGVLILGIFYLVFKFKPSWELVAIPLAIAGWLFSAWRDRVLQEEQFVMEKKFRAYEFLQKHITDYTRELHKLFDKIVDLQFSLGSVRREYEHKRWQGVQVEILETWLSASSAWVEFHRTFENYRIALTEIEELFFKLLNKHKEFERYIHSKTIENIVDYSDVTESVEKRTELKNLLGELSTKIMEQLVFNLDAVTGFQNRLFSNVFKRTVPKRKPTDPKYEVLE